MDSEFGATPGSPRALLPEVQGQGLRSPGAEGPITVGQSRRPGPRGAWGLGWVSEDELWVDEGTRQGKPEHTWRWDQRARTAQALTTQSAQEDWRGRREGYKERGLC